jgi:hypothetical protein
MRPADPGANLSHLPVSWLSLLLSLSSVPCRLMHPTERDFPLLSNDSSSSRELPQHVRLGGAGGRAVVEVGWIA